MTTIKSIITDEIIEKAARAGWERDHTYAPWENIPDDLRDYYRDEARATLTAAAPLIAAQALRDAAGSAIPRGALAHETRSWLRARAEQIEAREVRS